MNTLPCINCVCLPICKIRYFDDITMDESPFLKAYEGFSNLNKRCDLIGKYVRVNKHKFSTSRTYEVERFMTYG